MNRPWDGDHLLSFLEELLADNPDDPNENDRCPGSTSSKQSPVYVKSGNLNITFSDINIPGRGYGLRVEGSYNSQDRYDGPFGKGWVINLFTRLVQVRNADDEEIVIIRRPTGKRWRYKKDGDGYIALTEDISNKLIKKDDTYILNPDIPTAYIKDNFSYTFDENGFLVSIEDQNSNTLSLTYDSSNRLISAKDDAGRTLTFSYNSNSKVDTITAPDNKVFKYSYDEYNNLVKVTDPLSRSTVYKYDSENRLIEIVAPEGNTKLKVTYDVKGRVLNYTDYSGINKYNYSANITTKTTPHGAFSYRYDEGGNVQAIRYPDGSIFNQELMPDGRQLGMKDQNSNKIAYEYVDGNLFSKTEAVGTKDERTTKYGYHDAFDYIEKIEDFQGRIVEFEYDDSGNLEKVKLEKGLETSFVYDKSNGDLLSIKNANKKMTKFSYDQYGYLKTITDALNNTVVFQYDISGNLRWVKNQKGNTTYYDYDKANQLKKVTDALGNSSKIEYDKNGNVISIIGPDQKATKYTYNELDQVVKLTDAEGNETHYTYEKGNLHTITNAEKQISVFEYNYQNQITKVNQQLSATTDRITTYDYYPNGNLKSIKDSNDNETTYEYDALNRLRKTTYPDETSEIFHYDPLDNLISMTNREGYTTTYDYDELYRIEKIGYPDSTEISYTYEDLNVQTISVKGTNQSNITFEYDELDRVFKADQDGKVIVYEYDRSGNLKDLRYPGNTHLIYTYDKLDRLDQLKLPNNQVIADYQYDSKVSRRTKLERNNGTSTTYQYDKIGRLEKLINNKSESTILSKFKYTYNKQHNITSMTTTSGTHSYSYDKLNQLISVDYPNNSPFADTNYKFDTAGNRDLVSKTNGDTAEYSVNELNQYSKVKGDNLAYHKNGSLKSDGENIYQYDDNNRLTQLITHNDIISFTYDPLGRRISRKDSSGTVNYVYSGESIIEEYRNGELLRKYIYGPGIDEPIIMESDGKQYYYNFDALGSVTELTDSGGNVVESYEYDVYGKPLIKDVSGNILNQSKVGNPYLFTARRCDCDSNIYYYRARDYSPRLGRFLQPDPIGYVDGPNLYAYVHNNPVNLIDPKGLLVWDIVDVGFFSWSLHDFIKCPGFWTGASLALDTISLLPLIPSMGWITRADDIYDIVRSIDRADDAYDAIRVSNNGLGKLDNVICFPPGTLVLMADGSTKRIEHIIEGEYVLADDPEDSIAIDKYEVIKTIKNKTKRLIHVLFYVNRDLNGEFKATGEHPIWTINRGWVFSKDLVKGDILKNRYGDSIEVLETWEEKIISDTYNLSVKGVHSFFIVANETSILVHNDPPIIHPIAPDWAVKGTHVTSNGIELRITSGGNNIRVKPVFSRDLKNPRLTNAIRNVESSLHDSRWRNRLLDRAQEATKYLGKGNDIARATSGSTNALAVTLRKWCK